MSIDEIGQERRDLFRMGIRSPVKITGLSDGREEMGEVLDLSGSGLAIESRASFAIGDNFQVKVVPDKPIFMPLIADVEVIRVEQGDEGMMVYGLRICTLVS